MLSHDGLHNRPFLETIFSDAKDAAGEKKLDRLHDLYRMSLALFNYICPQEYGVTPEQKVSDPRSFRRLVFGPC